MVPLDSGGIYLDGARHGPRAPQEPDEVRGADQGGDQAGGDLGGRDDGAAEGVGEADQRPRRAAAATGRTRECRPPTRARAACGATRPTKPITPTAETAVEVSSAAAAERDQPGAFQPDAEHAWGVVVQRHQVELPSGGDHDRGEHQQRDQHRQHLGRAVRP